MRHESHDRPSATDPVEIWNAWAKHDALWVMTGSRLSMDALMESGRVEVDTFMAETAARNLSFGRSDALDFGCGLGRITQALCEHFDHVTGVDISQGMIATAMSVNRFGERCGYALCTGPDLSFIDDRSVDLVYAVNTFHHVTGDMLGRCLSELIRVMSTNGLMVINAGVSPNLRSVLRPLVPRAVRVWRFRRAGAPISPAAPLLPIYNRSVQKVRGLVEAAGGRIVAVDQTGQTAQPRYLIRRTAQSG